MYCLEIFFKLLLCDVCNNNLLLYHRKLHIMSAFRMTDKPNGLHGPNYIPHVNCQELIMEGMSL